MRFTSIESVKQYLEQIPQFQSSGSSAADFDLTGFENFCASIGTPQQDFPAIHVAGSNGKGSVCNILHSVLATSGYSVGMYTSPHIFDFKERFVINGDYISDHQLLAFFRQYGDRIEEYELTYFEISTAIAFWWFARSKVDIAVIEVGLGGRLDATNIINSLVSVITSITLDHTDILGDTIEEIAREKGGIIKQGCPVVIGDLPVQAHPQIAQIANNKLAELHTIKDLDPAYVKPGHFQLIIDGDCVDITTNLVAPVQGKNIAIAWQTVRQIQDEFPVSRQQFLTALQNVDLGFGRFEKLIDNQQWYFDGGHNFEAIKELKESIKTVGQIDEAMLVLSIMKDKLRTEVIDEFSEFKNIYYYPLGLERAATFDDINQQLPQAKLFPGKRDQQSFLNDFDAELVIFSGSFYFYETVRDWVSIFALNH
jgi:dihydrofolate synthase/folylpolyglutamate synthase